MPECPECHERNADGARFCSACGAGLDAGAGAREERKVVSVLFVDLVEFTARSDRADPEDVRDVLRTYHARVREQVELFGGAVEKFIGDAVMAVFGAPLAHTDDAERAVRAGLRVLTELEALNREQPGLALAARAAVNTGEAVVALGAGHTRGEALALGDVVNTASRMQSAAPAGRLVVGEETFRATRDAVHYEPLEPVVAKGKAEPLPVWLAVEATGAPAERRLRGGVMVGRERELLLLEMAWERASKERRPQLVTVTGPPGIGKSRLMRECAGLVERSGGRVIRGRCLPYDTREVYGAFAHQVRQLADIFEQDPAETARRKLADATATVVPAEERQDIVRSLSLMLGLGLDPPIDEQLFLLYCARRLVECLGIQQPTLLVFEDVHWADAGLLDLVEHVAAHARDTPVLLLAVARPELADIRPTWGSGLHAHSTIALDPLPAEDAAVVVASLLGDDAQSERVRRLVEVAEGNPLFLEELTAAVVEGAGSEGQLPTTVRAAIAGRIDTLPPDCRRVLLAASVAGRSFWRGTLTALGEADGIDGLLDTLELKDLVRRQPVSRIQGDVEFTFKHILIRDVCYQTLPRDERKRAHGSVAGYIEQVVGVDDPDLAWLLAHHWEQAGDIERAIGYLLLAADRARDAMAMDEAITLLQRAESLAASGPAKTAIRLRRALIRVWFEDYDEAPAELQELLPELEGRDLVDALLGLARCWHWTEQTAQTFEAAQQALETAERIGASDLVPPAMARLSQAYAMRGDEGDLDRAVELGERALADWVSGARTDDRADHEHLLADQHYWVGNVGRALELSRAVRAHALDPGSAEALLRGGGFEGLLLASTGRYEEAFARADAQIALGREMGRPVRVLLNYSTLAYRDVFDLAEARRRSEEALAFPSRSPSFHMPWMNAEVDLMHCDVLAGEYGAAEHRWRRMWDEVLATTAWERWLLGGRMAALRAEVALHAEGPDAATEWAETAIDMARRARRVKYEAVARSVLGRALVQLGRHEEGTRELRMAADCAAAFGSPAGRWPVLADLAGALAAMGAEAEAEQHLRAAVGIVNEMAGGLGRERAERFLAAPRVAEVVAAL